jgi:2-polyprenyl-3-methyl-5-hydroxy-6-metoxy-1,4-benzoquinol methylase
MLRTGLAERGTPRACGSCGSDRIRRRYVLRAFDVYVCETCTIAFRHPLPTEGELVAMYESDAYHESAYFRNAQRGYDERAPEVQIYSRALDDLAALVPAGRLLDIGCGTGVFLDLARRMGWDARGVELSERHAAHARATFGVEVWQGDFLAAPLTPASFQVVTMWDFLEHTLDPRAVLAAAHRLLGPDGVLLVFTIDSSSLFNLCGDLLHRVTARRAVCPIELLYDARHNWYFTRAALARVIESAGFRIERWRSDRAYLGRWLAEPAPWYVVAGGHVIDLVSAVAGRPYRWTAYGRRVEGGI